MPFGRHPLKMVCLPISPLPHLEMLLVARFWPEPSSRAGYGDCYSAPVDCAAKSNSLPAACKPNPLERLLSGSGCQKHQLSCYRGWLKTATRIGLRGGLWLALLGVWSCERVVVTNEFPLRHVGPFRKGRSKVFWVGLSPAKAGWPRDYAF